MRNSENRLYVRNLAQKILWDEELAGQISDGMWENATPHEHWIPWCDATVVVAPSHVGRTFFARKDGYKLNSKELLDIVGDRMLEAVQSRLGDGYGRADMMKDLADLRKIMKIQVARLTDEEQAAAVLEGASEPFVAPVPDGTPGPEVKMPTADPFAGQPLAKDPYEGHRNGTGQQVDEPGAAAPAKLMRKPAKTVVAYVDWLKGQLGGEAWAELSLDPTRLAQVSLQNYGAYQAARKADR